MNGFRTVLLVAALAGLVAASVLPTGARAQTAPKTYVVDAVDAGGSRWVSADNGTSEITVEVGDTVRWEFDQATMGHDVTSNSPNWTPPLSGQYRDPNGAAVEYTFTKTGEFRYTCTIHGGMNGIVNVVPDAPANGAPTADPLVDPKTGPAPLYVHFEARASDPDGDPLTYRWDFGDGSTVSNSAHTHHSYTAPGNYTATLKVTDGKGGELNRSFPISVSNGQAPTVTASGNPLSGDAPLSVTFMASGQDPQGDPVTLSWDFGVAGHGCRQGHRQQGLLPVRPARRLHRDRDGAGPRRQRGDGHRSGHGQRGDRATGVPRDRGFGGSRLGRNPARGSVLDAADDPR